MYWISSLLNVSEQGKIEAWNPAWNTEQTRCKERRSRLLAGAEPDNNGFVNILTAQMFTLELISLIRVMAQIQIFGLLWYDEENVCYIELFYLPGMCPSCWILGLTIKCTIEFILSMYFCVSGALKIRLRDTYSIS